MLAIIVLLWKHFLVRKRRFINTLVQLFSVVVLLLFLYLLNKMLMKEFREIFRVKAKKPNKLLDDEVSSATPLRVLYTPRTNATDALMDGVGETLGLSRLDHLPNDNEKGIAPFANEQEMAWFIKRMHRGDAIVIFGNDVYEGLPRNLAYTIRMKMDFDTGLDPTMRLDDEELHRADLSNAVFVKVQWAVDKSYLQMLTGEKISQRLRLVKKSMVMLDVIAPYLIWLAAYLCTVSHVHVFLELIVSLLDEKNTGIQELLKLMGVSNTAVVISHFLNTLPAGLVYALGGAGLLTAGEYAVMIRTTFGAIAAVLFTHYCSVMAMGIFLAAILNATQRQATVVILTYFLLSGLGYELTGRHLILDPDKVFRGGFPPHGGLWLFMARAAKLEKTDRGMSQVVLPVIIMVSHTCVFLLLAIFFFYLMPGKYVQGGRPLSWRGFTDMFRKSEKKRKETIQAEAAMELNPKYFEVPPDGSVGIEILDVTMKYGNNVVLDKVTLDIYEGEITVLIGHNGAGKTTLMNIIIGALKPTTGDVLVNGFNTRTEMGRVHRQLGLCPQHNLYYSYLTVSEQYQIFSMLKGVSCMNTRKACKNILKELNLTGKSSSLVSSLSWGMKRRVQLACALAGGASVLVLDEPTSGVDAEMRREFWEILLALRTDRTVLMTTQYMDEADAIGDRIAALYKGQVKCFASPMLLKKSLGFGYKLTLAMSEEPMVPALTALVRCAVPSATLMGRLANTITYNLPAKHSSQLPVLLHTIKRARPKLGLETMTISPSSLEDVFAKFCADSDAKECTNRKNKAEVKDYPKADCISRYVFQFLALIKRQLLYMWSKKCSLLIVQLLVPLALVIFLAVKASSHPAVVKNSTNIQNLGLDMYHDSAPRVLYDTAPGSYLPVMRSGYKSVHFVSVPAFSEDMFNTEGFRVGIHINNTHATVLYSEAGPLAAPAAVNVLSNTMAARMAGNPRAIFTLVQNDPEQQNTYNLVLPKSKYATRVFCVAIVFLSLVHLSGSVALPSAEREAGTRHLLLMAGCPYPLYWFTTLTMQVWITMLVVALPGCLLGYLLDRDATFRYSDFITAFFLLLLLAVLANCSFNNLISLYFSEQAATNFTVMVLIAFGLLLGTTDRLVLERNFTDSFWYRFIEASFSVMPPQVAIEGALQVARVALAKAWCSNNVHQCPDWFTKDELADELACCNTSRPSPYYYSVDSKGVGGELIFLGIQFGAYTLLLLCLDSRLFSRLAGTKAFPVLNRFTDPAIQYEKEYVKKLLRAKSARKNLDAVLMYDLCKKFLTGGRICFAVKGISFCVKKGECFGLLGANGAGKTTTMETMSAKISPSHGTLFSIRHFFRRRYAYMRTYSYCTQYQSLDTFLTGRQTLELMLTMRGFKRAVVKRETLAWLEDFGLMPYADKLLSRYSGGCARRLAAAAALCQRTDATLLDEPMAGVDPVALRCMHAAIVQAKKERRSIIIASQNLNLMEALCERMAIMSGGLFATLGSSSRLRCRLGKGFIVTFKLFPYIDDEPEEEGAAGGADAGAGAGAGAAAGAGAGGAEGGAEGGGGEGKDATTKLTDEQLSAADGTGSPKSQEPGDIEQCLNKFMNEEATKSDEKADKKQLDKKDETDATGGLKLPDPNLPDPCPYGEGAKKHQLKKPKDGDTAVAGPSKPGEAAETKYTAGPSTRDPRADGKDQGALNRANQGESGAGVGTDETYRGCDCDEDYENARVIAPDVGGGAEDQVQVVPRQRIRKDPGLSAADDAGDPAVVVKTPICMVKDENPDIQPNRTGLQTLDEEMHCRFNCNVMDSKKKVVVQYRINQSIPYGEVFAQIEELKIKYPNLIEDYSMSDITLEQVVIYFAKEAIEYRKNYKQMRNKIRREPFFKKWFGGGPPKRKGKRKEKSGKARPGPRSV